jgi:hypothetical protein
MPDPVVCGGERIWSCVSVSATLLVAAQARRSPSAAASRLLAPATRRLRAGALLMVHWMGEESGRHAHRTTRAPQLRLLAEREGGREESVAAAMCLCG